MKNWQRLLSTPLDDDTRREVARLVRATRAAQPALVRAGAVVEFRQGGQLGCGFLAHTPSGRRAYTVVGVDGRQRHLRRDKVVDLASQYVRVYPPDQALAELRAVDAAREQASEQVDIDTLWRVVVEAGPERSWKLEELLELHEGGTPSHPGRKAGLLRALWRGERFDRDGRDWRPKTTSAVQDMAAAKARADAATTRRAELAAWVRRVADGGPGEPRPAGAEEAVAWLETAALGEETPEAAALMQAAHLHGAGAAVDVLVRLGHWSEHENRELHRLGVPVELGAEALAAAAAVDAAAAQADWPGRRRWGGSVYAGADGERAYRVRRALRGGPVVDIHLAVPALLVSPGGAVDVEAAQRGTAVRLLEGPLPLLPASIARASALVPTAARPALTLTVRLDEALTPRQVRLTPSRVRPRAVLAVTDPASPPGPVRRLAALATALRQRRRRAGAWEGLQAVPWIELHEGIPRRARETLAQRVDTELELLAREALALLWAQAGLPAVYAGRETPSAALLPDGTDASDTDTSDGVEARGDGEAGGEPGAEGAAAVPEVRTPAGDAAAEEVVRSFLLEGRAARASLTVRGPEAEPAPHAGLGLTACAAGTRPLSDYVDLVLQRQLLAAAGVRAAALQAPALEEVLTQTQAAREAAAQVERRSQRDWSLVWLAGFGLDDRLECVVVEPRGAGHLVLLAGGPVSGYVPAAFGERLEAAPGQRLWLRVEQASLRGDVLRLADPQPRPPD